MWELKYLQISHYLPVRYVLREDPTHYLEHGLNFSTSNVTLNKEKN